MNERFIGDEDELEVEDPIGSGLFISMREFNRRIAGQKALAAAEKPAQRPDGEQAPSKE